MRENALGQRQVGGHEKRRPVDRMKAHDFFADQMQVRGPEIVALAVPLPAHGRQVGHQRVEPDVEDVIAFYRDRDAPFDGGPADRKIIETLLHKGDHFVAPRFGLYEVRLLLV